MISEKLLIVNFGGPRSLQEIESFLIALLTDRDVISSKMPNWLHQWFFSRLAKKRSGKVVKDYQLIGGKSPIFEDTEWIAKCLSGVAFHRYLTATHPSFIQEVEQGSHFTIFPLFPQFSYTTSGSIARWFSEHLSHSCMHWIASYCDHPAYVKVMVDRVRDFLVKNQLNEEETVFLFSAHGLPQDYIDRGDPYQKECERTFSAIACQFPHASSFLSYQSKFGRGEWIKPYTDEWCVRLFQPRTQDKQVVVIPLSFTSDHIETLFEIEQLYLPMLEKRGVKAYRLPALNRHPDWIKAMQEIIRTSPRSENYGLINKNLRM